MDGAVKGNAVNEICFLGFSSTTTNYYNQVMENLSSDPPNMRQAKHSIVSKVFVSATIYSPTVMEPPLFPDDRNNVTAVVMT